MHILINKIFKQYIYMQRNRKYCQGANKCFAEEEVTFKKNIGISQPKEAPKNLNRTNALGTRFEYPSSVLNKRFSSMNMGFSTNNKLQKTLNTDKTVNPSKNFVQGDAWSNGYINKSQSKLESNTGSMDRLARLKAQAVYNSNN